MPNSIIQAYKNIKAKDLTLNQKRQIQIAALVNNGNHPVNKQLMKEIEASNNLSAVVLHSESNS